MIISPALLSLFTLTPPHDSSSSPLGDEEQKLKRRRDLSHGKYYKLKKQLNSSVEALEQIEVLSKSLDPGEDTEADLEQETTEEKVNGKMNGEVNGTLDGETTVTVAPVKNEAGPDEASAETAAAAGEVLTSAPTGETATGEGSTPTENSASQGENQSDKNLAGGDGAKETGDTSGGDTTIVGGGVDLNPTPTTTTDDEILPFIGNDDINLLDQENFPLPRVENEGEGVDAMATTTPQDSSHMLSSTEVDDQVSALMRQATPSDSALPFSDLPFS